MVFFFIIKGLLGRIVEDGGLWLKVFRNLKFVDVCYIYLFLGKYKKYV